MATFYNPQLPRTWYDERLDDEIQKRQQEEGMDMAPVPSLPSPDIAPPPAEAAAPPPAPAPGLRLPPASDWRMESLGRAQDRDNAASVGAELSNNIYNAFTGRPVQVQDRASQGVQQFSQREALAEKERAASLAREANDPNSAASQTWRQMVASTMPDVVKHMGPSFERLTAAKGKEYFPFLKEGADALQKQGMRKEDRLNKVGDVDSERTWKEQQSRLDRASRERAAALASGQKATNQTFSNATDLRRQLLNDPVTKAVQEAKVSWSKIQTAAKDPSAAGDLALIFNFMKTLDPGSTVREGEFANAQNAGGVDTKVLSMYNSVRDGTRLTSQQRQDFLRRAGEAFKAHRDRYSQLANQFTGIAERNNLDPKDVVLDILGDGGGGSFDLTEPVIGKSGRKLYQRPDGNWEAEE